MKRIIKTGSLILGAILILNAALLAVIANLNIGLLPVLCLGLIMECFLIDYALKRLLMLLL